MEQALSVDALRHALGNRLALPSPEELAGLLAKAEAASFIGEPLESGALLTKVAWNLHHVGTARPELDLFDVAHQVSANAVAAHIFALLLRDPDLPLGDRLVMTFAAQVSSIRGAKAPNATALWRKLPALPTVGRLGKLTALTIGSTFLGLNRRAILELIARVRDGLRIPFQEDADWDGPLEPIIGLVHGCSAFWQYLVNGNRDQLQRARDNFFGAATTPANRADLDARWVAAHLLDLCDDLERSSIWSVLPEGTPPSVGQFMTLGEPSVLSLWPPQVRVLNEQATSPLRSEVTRAVLTLPTSAGKTLLAHLVVAQHLATQGSSVCIVAPTHSLCREIATALDRRMWLLHLPGGVREEQDWTDQNHVSPGSVVVTTPERLSARLRADESQLLSDFGMFIFDEAHLIGEKTRGWVLETVISRLHELTGETNHRLLLISAALGSSASVRSWMGLQQADGDALPWRAPRRLKAIYEVREDRGSERGVPRQGKQRLDRTVTDVYGRLRILGPGGGAIVSIRLPIGIIERFGASEIRPTREASLVPLVKLAANDGAVLTVHATRERAERMADKLAESRLDPGTVTELTRYLNGRLGEHSELSRLASRRVAFHHAGIPQDVQHEIEAAFRRGDLEVLCATSTLIDGVNLPARTVIVAETETYLEDGPYTVLGPAQVLNAAGRAGRAGLESEGIVVIVDNPGSQARAGAVIRHLDGVPEPTSALATQDAESALADYEQLVADVAGHAIVNAPKAVDDFLAYCWYLLEVAEHTEDVPTDRAVLSGLHSTLAWNQLSEELRTRWESVARRAVQSYLELEPAKRRRWARSGLGLSVNALLEGVLEAFRARLPHLEDRERRNPLSILSVVLADGHFETLLSVFPEGSLGQPTRAGRQAVNPNDLVSIVLDWVHGWEIGDLAQKYMQGPDGRTTNTSVRKMQRFVNWTCQHFLPWCTSVLLDWMPRDELDNAWLDLPSFLRFGVSDSLSLELLENGVRSRRLALRIAHEARAENVNTDALADWLCDQGLAMWRERFGAAPSEVNDLLRFVRDSTSAVVPRLLRGDLVPVRLESMGSESHVAVPHRMDFDREDSEYWRIVVKSIEDTAMAEIPPSLQHDLAKLLDSGYEIAVEPSAQWLVERSVLVRLLYSEL